MPRTARPLMSVNEAQVTIVKVCLGGKSYPDPAALVTAVNRMRSNPKRLTLEVATRALRVLRRNQVITSGHGGQPIRLAGTKQ